jgi:hypothetical protein
LENQTEKENLMSTIDFIIELFCRVDDAMPTAKKHPQANLRPSEVVTLAILFALKGVGNRAFYRWLTRDYKIWFSKLPARTRLFRLFNSHRHWTKIFMAEHSLIGHPRREGRSEAQIGRKGQSNRRRIVGAKFGYVLNHLGRIVDWDVETASVYDGTAFQALVERHQDFMAIFSDEGFGKVD